MFSNEFMKFLFEYQKEDFKPQEKVENNEIKFKTPQNGKLAKVYLTNTIKD